MLLNELSISFDPITLAHNKIMFSNGSGDSLTTRGKSERKDQKNSRQQSRSKSRGKKLIKCFIYYKESHFKCDYPEKRSRYKEKDRESSNAKASVAQDGY